MLAYEGPNGPAEKTCITFFPILPFKANLQSILRPPPFFGCQDGMVLCRHAGFASWRHDGIGPSARVLQVDAARPEAEHAGLDLSREVPGAAPSHTCRA